MNRSVLLTSCVVLLPLSSVLAQHAGDMWIGRSAEPENRLKLDVWRGLDPEAGMILLPPISGGILQGWSDNDPGFDRIITPNAEHDVQLLTSGAAIRLEVVSIDPGLRVIVGLNIIDAPGENAALGGSTLHIHPTWHLNSASPDFDRRRCVWEGTFKLRDTGSTGYQESEPFTMQFATHIPIPADFDCDADVDADDFAHLRDCTTGPAVPLDEPLCMDADLDGDSDVDGSDFAVFQRCLSGEGVPADPMCGG